MSSHTRAAHHEPVSRRLFLATSATAAASLALGCNDGSFTTSPSLARAGAGELPDPAASGIEHVIVVMMENRSFDHLAGWLPGADGRQAGLKYSDSDGAFHHTYPLAPDFQGCGHQDPDHSYEGARVEYDGGACDGWLRVNDIYAIGYYGRKDLPFLGQALPGWSSFDHYFCAFLGPTFPNRFYQHAAQTDRLSNLLVLSTLPTIWDRLASAGLSGRYYFSDLPFVALWGPKYLPISRSIDTFFSDCATGTLPAVAFVDPSFATESTGTGNDDHPFNDVRAGEAFLNHIYSAVTDGPAWANTVLVINFDEWGGFFDHVAPARAPIPDGDRAAGSDGFRGFRTPMVMVSPFARRKHLSHVLYDHTSVLRMIEWRWGLAPLTVRDATANNLAEELDFDAANLTAPVYDVPVVTGAACPASASDVSAQAAPRPGGVSSRAHWTGLREVARENGWKV